LQRGNSLLGSNRDLKIILAQALQEWWSAGASAHLFRQVANWRNSFIPMSKINHPCTLAATIYQWNGLALGAATLTTGNNGTTTNADIAEHELCESEMMRIKNAPLA